MDGWIKLHRKVFENPVVCKDSDYFIVWVYLLSNAASRRVKVLFGKRKITLEAGRPACSGSKIARKLNINREKVRRIFAFFAKEGQIVQQIEPYGKVITICSWSDYQFCVQPFAEEELLGKSIDNQGKNWENGKTVCNDSCKQVCKLHASFVQPLSFETSILPSVESGSEDVRVPLEVVPYAWSWVKMREETGRPLDRSSFLPMYQDLKKIAPTAEEQIEKFEEWTKNKDIGREILSF